MKDLIAGLEAATEGSRELDYRIACLVTCGAGPFGAYKSASQWVKAAIAGNWNSPHYTTSLDSALTLVPEGAEFDMTTMYGVARVTVGLNFNPGPFYASNDCGLLPCAVSAAALKARESQP